MSITAAIVGAVGGLCAVMGIITAAEVIPLIMPQFTWTFWFSLSAILLLASIAFALGSTSYE
jgi:ABC-type dipeptide/oligopeptide/nickel transport system permease component